MPLIEDLLKMESLESLPFAEDFNPKGWIYVLSSESMPGMFKVGMTRNHPRQRAGQLSKSSGSPTPFIIEAKFISTDPERDEKILHEALSRFRVNQSREFFSCPLDRILVECRRFLPYGESTSVEELCGTFNFVTFGDYFLPHDTEFMLLEMGISAFGSKGNAYWALANIGAALVKQLTEDGGTLVFTGEGFELVKPTGKAD
ncbi:GIY-YIG nuclease family protein [Rahnella sp. PD12R]|uniref:GIY-YIG nuclease family protein n=1 Tax=Rahnella sp. PD12R TaxID=2855688 RepID=UPI001C48A27A|nr:GIY-YIG nuclease family protein [Rahnella sp. PD12R]MBV6817546.1 GIY-YIG nuclease family protein [Rahnella sp. PD12R]